MNRNEVVSKFNEICKDVFENDSLEIFDSMTAEEVEGWDSLSHLSLVSEIMEEFGVNLTLDEINNSKNIGELIDAVMNHLNKQ